MFKLLDNNYYIPTATEVAIGQRSSKLFLLKYHILNSGSICRLIIFSIVITSLLWKCKGTYLFLITEHCCKFFHLFTTTKQLSKIPCNRFAFTEKQLLRKGLSHLRTDRSQNHHNRQLNITATEKMLYISMWQFRAMRFGTHKCAVVLGRKPHDFYPKPYYGFIIHSFKNSKVFPCHIVVTFYKLTLFIT